jgi:hypothetical protein
MVVITNIYAPNERTQQTLDSFSRFDYELAVNGDNFRGNGQVLRDLFACYNRAIGGHETFIYTDGADTFCQRKFEPPTDHLLFSTEKACYPHTWVAEKYPPCDSPWKFVNGGGYGGPLKLIIEFFERYGLTTLPGDANGQHELMLAYLQALQDGFPVKLDTQCEIFQTMAFADPSEFEIVETFKGIVKTVNKEDNPKYLKNIVTGKIPAILHFNGLTDMSILKQLK